MPLDTGTKTEGEVASATIGAERDDLKEKSASPPAIFLLCKSSLM